MDTALLNRNFEKSSGSPSVQVSCREKACSVLQAESIIDEMMSEELPVNFACFRESLSLRRTFLERNITLFSVLQLVCLLCSYDVAFCFLKNHLTPPPTG